MKSSGGAKDHLAEYLTDVDTDLANIVRSINSGFKPPRMTTAQRNALTNLFPGMVIYNVSTNKLNVYTTAWEQITSS